MASLTQADLPPILISDAEDPITRCALGEQRDENVWPDTVSSSSRGENIHMLTPGRRAALFVVVCGFASACGGPLLIIPGGALSGEVVSEPVADWSFLEDGVFELETRPDDPYSIQLNYRVVNGQIYIDPAEGRSWLEYIRADAGVRGRFDGRVYPLKAVLVGEPGRPYEDFDPERFVYRLEPRTR